MDSFLRRARARERAGIVGDAAEHKLIRHLRHRHGLQDRDAHGRAHALRHLAHASRGRPQRPFDYLTRSSASALAAGWAHPALPSGRLFLPGELGAQRAVWAPGVKETDLPLQCAELQAERAGLDYYFWKPGRKLYA